MKRDVLGERELEHETSPVPVLGDVAEPLVEMFPCRRPRQLAAVDDDPARGRMAEPGERVDELRLAVPVDARDPDDLAGANLERDPAHHLETAVVDHVYVLGLENRSTRLGRLLLHPEEHLPADHHPREARLGRAGPRDGVDLLAAAEDGDQIRDLEDLLQLVADEDDRLPLRLEALEDLEELACLLRRQHGRRLVEDEDLRAAVERLQDLDALLLADRDVLDPRVRVDVELELVGELAHTALGGGSVEQHGARPGLQREHDVLGHGHHRDEHEVLVDHADACVDCGVRRADLRRLAVEQDLALVVAVEPVEDVHQGRLAGAVLAEQCVHLAAPDVEIDIVVGDDPRELLADAPHFQDERIGHRPRS